MATYRQILESLNLNEVSASDQAKKAGLKWSGQAWVDKKGNAVAKTVDNKLVYIDKEKPNTTMNLENRIQSIHGKKVNDIEVRFDGSQFTNQSFQIVQQLPEILANDKELDIGTFKLDVFDITIYKLKTYEMDLIK